MLKKNKNILIVGGHEQAVLMLKFILDHDLGKVVGCVCRTDDTGEDMIFPSLSKVAKDYGVKRLFTDNINSRDFFSLIKSLNPELVLSLQNNRVFSARWVDYFSSRLGIVNVHYAPLPKYAGFWPELWAIWNQEKEFAVTAHYVGNGIDTGDIIDQRWFSLEQFETRKSLYDKSTDICYKMLCNLMPDILNGCVTATPQDHSKRTYYERVLPEQGYLDLNWEQEKIERFIRAISFPGYPGPKILIGKNTYTLYEGDYEFFQSGYIKGDKV